MTIATEVGASIISIATSRWVGNAASLLKVCKIFVVPAGVKISRCNEKYNSERYAQLTSETFRLAPSLRQHSISQ